MRGYFISWAEQNGRTSDLAAALSLSAVFVDRGPADNNLIKRYAYQLRETRRLLASVQPGQTVFLMLPPAPLLIAFLSSRNIRRRKVFFDLHTGFFYNPKWKWAAQSGLRLMKAHHAVVTNQHLAARCEAAGVGATVLHDILTARAASTRQPEVATVVAPLSYANDEPVSELVAAARQLPSIDFILTGRAPQEVRDGAPRNVRFSGFISPQEYDELINSSSAVIALTNRPHTMQRAAYEAMMHGVPVVTSRFPELIEFFEDSAVYTDLSAFSIAAAVEQVVENNSSLRSNIRRVFSRRRDEQQKALKRLQSLMA